MDGWMDSKFVAPSNKMQSAFRLITNILGGGRDSVDKRQKLDYVAGAAAQPHFGLDTGIIIIVVVIIAESGQRSRETTTLNI